MADQAVQQRPPHFKDLKGRRFGRLLVMEYAGPRRNKRGRSVGSYWKCVCDCGTHRTVESATMLRGNATSCGCWHREATARSSRKHGGSRTAEYRHYRSMVSRCLFLSPSNPGWKNYKGRGITVCDRWLRGEDEMTGFECFLADMGQRPSGMDIDRIDPDGNYEPLNCRWVSRSDNLKNKRKGTHCEKGHPWTEESSYIGAHGRQCRICKSEYDKVRYRAKIKRDMG